MSIYRVFQSLTISRVKDFVGGEQFLEPFLIWSFSVYCDIKEVGGSIVMNCNEQSTITCSPVGSSSNTFLPQNKSKTKISFKIS